MAAAAARLEIVDVEERPYQQEIAQACEDRNSLIVLPTGLGKTLICTLVMARRLEEGARVLVLAPTRPLVEQHARTFRDHLHGVEIAVVTGQTAPDEREDAWRQAPVIVATPQVARNDVLTGTLDPETWGLLVVDEAHRAVGGYAAVTVAEELRHAGVQVLGATASPGGEAERIQEVCDNLGIEHIEARGPQDEDVRAYIEPVRTDWVRVSLPRTLEQAATSARKVAEAEVAELRSRGHYPSRFTSRRELLKARRRLDQAGSSDNRQIRRARGQIARALKALHAVQLIQTQSVAAAQAYLTDLTEDDDRLAQRAPLKDARRLLDRYLGEHPKMRRCAAELRDHICDDPGAKAIVFTQFRATARRLAEALDEVIGLDPVLFVGQSGKDGMSQTDQVETLDAFREGTHNVLVATSVGEEGLDVPSVGLVVFYEPIASPVRTIQRRGRTGRQEAGRVVLLMARGTSDEATYWSAAKKEREMRAMVCQLRSRSQDARTPTIRPNPAARARQADDGPKVIVDHRELNGPLARLLRQEGIEMEPQTLPTGDVILSNRLVVERKAADDFCKSIIDGRLMEQARGLKRNFEAPLFLVEGNPFEERRGIQRAAVAGAIATLSARFGVTVLTVGDVREAAKIVAAMARQEQDEGRGPPKLRHGTAGRTTGEQQRYLMEGLPQVSAKRAARLLESFGTPAAVFRATEEDLRKVHGIGPTTARAIHEVLHARFEAPWHDADSTTTPAQVPGTPSGTGAKRSGS